MNEPKFLALSGGRTMAYANAGDTSSSTAVLFFHGFFSAGDASRPSPVIIEKGVHFVAPTLPGWGQSSPPNNTLTYAASLAADITALLNHLYPRSTDLKLYIGGGSYGTVSA